MVISQIPLPPGQRPYRPAAIPLFQRGKFFTSLWYHFPVFRQAKGGAAVQSRTAQAKPTIGTLAPDGGEGFYERFFKELKG